MVLFPGCACCCQSPGCQDICPYYVQFLTPSGFTLGGVGACKSSYQDGLNVSQIQARRANDFVTQSQNLDASGLPDCGYSGGEWSDVQRLSQISANIDRTYKYMVGFGVNGFSTFASPDGELNAMYISTLEKTADLSPLSARCLSGKRFFARSDISLRFGCNLNMESPGKQRLQLSFVTRVEIRRDVVAYDGTSATHPCNQYVPGGSYSAYLATLPAFGGHRHIVKTWDSQNLTASEYAQVFADISLPAYCPTFPATSCGPHIKNDLSIDIAWNGISGLLSGVSSWHNTYTYVDFGNVSDCFDSYSAASLNVKLGRLDSCDNPLP
jgi:hypothetical protein